MTQSIRFTSRDLDLLPDVEGVRHEIIDGDLYVSKTPHLNRQVACHRVAFLLERPESSPCPDYVNAFPP